MPEHDTSRDEPQPTPPSHARRDAALAMSRDEFRRLGHDLVEAVAAFLEGLPGRPVTPDESPETLRALIGGARPLPERGEPAAELLASAASLLFDHSLFNGHPRFFGYITSSPAPIGILGELLAAAVNPNVGAWTLSLRWRPRSRRRPSAGLRS